VIRIPRTTPAPPPTSDAVLREWFAEALPDDWFTGDIEVLHDDDEIIVSGDLGEAGAGLTDEEQIGAFREATREGRMEVAARAQAIFRRKVGWEARCGDVDARFTHVSSPAMTRLRLEERRLLDTLIEAGVARSRSEALAWCVRLVAEHEADWIAELREATEAIREVRDRGPNAT
jgi:hypothetical protein